MPERDPIRDLESFSLPGDDMNPMSAAQVRQAGDRRRRRRSAGIALGTAAVVAAVAVGGSLLVDPGRQTVPDPLDRPSETIQPTETSQTPGVEYVTAIPATFPLDEGLPDPSSDDTEEFPVADTGLELSACGDLWPQSGAVDQLGLVRTGPGGVSTVVRELVTFPDAAGAEANLSDLRGVLSACGLQATTDPAVGDDTNLVNYLTDQEIGDQAFTLSRYYENGALGLETWLFVRVENAVYVTRDSGEGTEAIRDEMMADVVVTSEPVTSGMETVFGLQEPGDGDGDPGAGMPTSTLPAYPGFLETAPASEQVGQGDVPDLPLGVDLPDLTGDGGELLAAAGDVPGIERYLVCGESILDQELSWTGRLAASSSGPEYYEVHQVVGFADAAEAQAQMAYLRDLVNGCLRYASEGGTNEIAWTVIDEDTGYDDFTAGFSYLLPDSDQLAGTGGLLFQVTRVGRGIVVVARGGEYSGSESLAEAAPTLTRQSRELAPRLCSFTEAGC